MIRVLLINDNSAHPNWGAQATPYALVDLIRHSLQGCEIEALSHAWLRTDLRRLTVPGLRGTVYRYGSIPYAQTLLNRVSVVTDFFPAVADDFPAYADAWLGVPVDHSRSATSPAAKAADLIVYNGENSIYRNTREGCRSLFLTYLARTRLGRPTAAVNQTVHLDDILPIMPAMVSVAYRELDLVATREPRSLACLEALGVAGAEAFPDVVFWLDPGRFPRDGFEAWARRAGLGDERYLCLSASGLPASPPRGGDDGAVTRLVRALQGLGLRVVLVARDGHCQFLGEVAARTGSLLRPRAPVPRPVAAPGTRLRPGYRPLPLRDLRCHGRMPVRTIVVQQPQDGRSRRAARLVSRRPPRHHLAR